MKVEQKRNKCIQKTDAGIEKKINLRNLGLLYLKPANLLTLKNNSQAELAKAWCPIPSSPFTLDRLPLYISCAWPPPS